MNLPGLEGRSRVEIADIATKEGWPVRDIRTPGGSRRVYDVPGKYIEGSSHATNQASNVVGSIAAGSKDVDWDMMDLAMSALSEWEQERGIVIEQSRRSAIISVLYDYLVRGEADKLERVFKAIG